MDKKAIAAVLDEMGTLLELQGANPFKSRAFHNASRAVDQITGDLAELIRTGGLMEIKGIGKSIGAIITELAATGESEEYTELRKSFPDGLFQILQIEGLGPKRIKILFDNLGIKDIDALEKAAKEDKLSSVSGFGKKTQDNIIKGIAAVRSRGGRKLFPAAQQAAQEILAALKTGRGVKDGEIAGSIRRQRETIGDIDLVLSAADSDRPRLMDAFVALPQIESVIARGETKTSAMLKAGIQCDLRIVTPEEYPFALNYFTGSKEHNVELRGRARKRGLSLNEYGFSKLESEETRGKAKRAVRCRDEADVYAALGLAFIAPELRENMGEIERAEENGLPNLVKASDIRGTFHCHTTYSDGLGTLEQMATAAANLGWEYLGIADHSKAAAYAGGLTKSDVKRQFREIDTLNKRLQVRLLKGTECDILPNGDLDWPDDFLSEFDYVVASVHSNFKMPEEAMTRRILKALKNKHVTMLGHPTGRLLLAREPYALNMTRIIDAAAEYGKIIEINAYPNRLDLDWRFCKYARERGMMTAINPDAHRVEELRHVYLGVSVARKGWLEKKDVLNTRPLTGVLKYLGNKYL
jgi:DNA polymerase (family X)